MNHIGAVASAGGMIDFTIMTVGTRNVQGTDPFGYLQPTGTGDLSNKTIIQGDNTTVGVVTAIEDRGSQIFYTISPNGGDSDTNAFKTMVIGALRLVRTDAALILADGTTYGWNSTDTTISDAGVGGKVVIQWRRD